MTEKLIIICTVCRGRIAPDAGILWADMRELPDSPDSAPAPWRIAHFDCAPELGAAVYSIELARASTPLQLLWWTAHLSEKTWLQDTTWMSCMRGVADSGRMDFGPGWGAR